MEFNDAIISVCKRISRPYARNFDQEYIKYYDILKSYKPIYSFIDPDSYPYLDSDLGLKLVSMKKIAGYSGYVLYTTDYKTVQLMEDLVEMLNNHHYLTTMAISRNLMENAANIFHYYDKLKNHVNHLESVILKSKDTKSNDDNVVKTTFSILNVLMEYSFKTGFNWPQLPKNFRKTASKYKLNEKILSKKITGLVKKLPRKYFFNKSPYNYYSRLCDFLHPNMASNFLFINEANQPSNYETQLVLSRENKNPNVLKWIIQEIYVPVLGSVKIIAECLEGLDDFYELFNLLNKNFENTLRQMGGVKV